MKFDLATMTRRIRNPRRTSIPIREIKPPATMAGNLYRACYLPIIQAWETGAARILVTYERALAQMTTDSPADVDADIADVEREIDRLLLVLTPRLRDWSVRTERWHRGKWTAGVLSASGVDLTTMLGAEEVRQSVEATIAWNTALIKDVSDQARNRISAAVYAGLHARTPAREVAATIREAVAMSRRRSINIASDQLSKITSALDSERMGQAGIARFLYRHSGKLHPRSWHRARNGRTYELATGKEVGGSDVIAADDAPGVPPWCGCRKQAVVTFG
jgi:uncharacterized protein with gpF-like domain